MIAIDKLLEDLPQQFRDKEKIGVLTNAIDRQLNELCEVFNDLNLLRSIYTATGKQLDLLGEIVVLSRTEATKFLMAQEQYIPLDDETYRKCLIYKIHRNTCQCTYYDIMKAVEMFWLGPPISYTERLDVPATISLTCDASGEATMPIVNFSFIKPAGVRLDVHIYRNLSILNPTTVYTGGKVVRIHRTRPPIPASEYNTFDDLLDKYTYDDLQNMTYAELLYKK